uniref:Uncharacterized protein n=1 Tax=viral metagenome TaxID=1070528 RepID=A0A6C0CAH3_9ZZZZ
MLNSDICHQLFHILPISDKRSFVRTCKNIHRLSDHMPKIELSFQKMINDTYFTYVGRYNPLYKYTIELLFDGYDIPDRYIVPENQILYRYPRVYEKLGSFARLETIKKILTMHPYYLDNVKDLIKGAARANNIEILKWVCEKKKWKGIWYDDYATSAAIRGKNYETLTWLVEQGGMFSRSTFRNVREKGAILDYLMKYRYVSIDCYYIARSGHMDVIEYLYFDDPAMRLDRICEGAVCGGHLDILKFGYEKGYSLGKSFVCNHVYILEWLKETGLIQPDVNICTANLECLKYLQSIGIPIDEHAFANAIRFQNIEMIKYLHESGFPICLYPDLLAARTDNGLEILKLLVEWGYTLRDEVCHEAARHGNIEILEFAVSNGCRLDERVIAYAAYQGYLHVIIWARKKGCPWNAHACRNAEKSGNLDVLKWLRGVDRDKCGLISDETDICPWDNDIYFEVITNHHINILKFAIENGQKLSDEIYNLGINSDDKRIVEYMQSKN